MKYIVYLLTAALPAIKRIAGDTFVFQQYTTHQRIGSRSDRTVGVRNLRLHLSGSVAPNSPDLSPVDYKLWGSCNSRPIRRHSRMWMNSRSNRLKSGLVWSRTLLTLLSTHEETVCVLVFVSLRACVRAKGRHFEHLL